MTRSAYHALWLLIISATFLLAKLTLTNPSAYSLRTYPPLELSAAQQSALRGLTQVKIEGYVQRNPRLRRAIADTVDKVKAYAPNLTLQFQSLDRDPISAQARGITREGQLFVSLENGKGSRVDILSPLGIVNALLALAREGSSQLIHLQGHGERAFLSDSGGSWLAFYKQFQGSDLVYAAMTQGEMPLPQDSVLMMIDPQSALSDADEAELRAHLAQGNSMLYTTDTTQPYIPKALLELSGLELAAGVMVDADAKQYGLENPQWLVIQDLGDSEVTRDLKQAPILATAVALLPLNEPTQGFERKALLWSSAHSWSEKNLDENELKADDDEAKGALPLAWELSRPHPKNPQQTQRIFIMGDSDLGSSIYFSSGNRGLLNQMLHAMRSQHLPQAQNPELPDQYITLLPQSALGLGAVMIGGLPALVLLTWGVVVFWRRKRNYL